MTNSEAIKELRSRKLTMSMCIDIESCRNANNAIDMSISALEENDKLKAENERFRGVINALAKAVDKQDAEIKQLKASGKYMLDVQKNLLTESNERILENGKLKEEVKRLKGKSEMYQEMADCFCENNIKLKKDVKNATNCFEDTYEEYDKAKKEIEQLKSELEKSVKLTCKVGDVIYDNDFGSPTPSTIAGYSYGNIFQDDCEDMNNEEELYFYSRSNRFNIDMSFPSSEIGKTIFLTKEEAEQHLKGKV